MVKPKPPPDTLPAVNVLAGKHKVMFDMCRCSNSSTVLLWQLHISRPNLLTVQMTVQVWQQQTVSYSSFPLQTSSFCIECSLSWLGVTTYPLPLTAALHQLTCSVAAVKIQLQLSHRL